MKRPVMMIQDAGALRAFDSLSKAALIDLCVDLLRAGSSHDLDGEPLVLALRASFEAVANVRGDKLPIYRAPRPRCVDCGAFGESTGHMGCQYPGGASDPEARRDERGRDV